MGRRASSRIVLAAAAVAALLLAAPPAPAGDILRVTEWQVDPRTTAEFEAALVAHNELHREHGDTWAHFVGQVVTGENTGTYVRWTLDHDWADFDAEYEKVPAAEDAAHAVEHLVPHIESAAVTFYRHLPDLSRPPTDPGPAPYLKIVGWRLHPYQDPAFLGAVGELHALLQGREWPPYLWYQLEDGGHAPTYVLVLPRASWADAEPPKPSLAEIAGQALGPRAAEVFGAIADATAETWSYTLVARPDLSYVPSTGAAGEAGGAVE